MGQSISTAISTDSPLIRESPQQRDYLGIIRREDRKLLWMDISFGALGGILALYFFLVIIGTA